jgi:hypothetical protein
MLLLIHSLAFADQRVISRGWEPPSALVGQTQPAGAVNSIRELAALQKVVLSNTQVDRQTDRFVDELWATFESFDLHTFYQMLPDQEADYRSFSVHGAVSDGRYSLRSGPARFSGEKRDPRQFGELAVKVNAREIRNERESFLLGGQLSLGMGPIDFRTLSAASHKTLHLMVDGDDFMESRRDWRQAETYKSRVRHMNPELGDEDVAVIAPLWAAFPAMWDMLAKTGRVEDVVMATPKGESYRHLTFTFRIDPEVLQEHYPAIASHLDAMGAVTDFNLRFRSSEGELLRLLLDSETLTASVSGYVQDGFLVPVGDDGQPGKPFDTMFSKPWHVDVLGAGNTRILGVTTEMANIRVGMDFTPEADGARLVTSMTEVPMIEVKGRALGIMPTGLIDAFLPTNIDEIMREFMTVACEGNDGKGIYSEVRMRHATGQVGNTLHASASLEAINNVFIRFGMGIVNDRILPDPAVSLEIRQFLFDTQEAFSQDLESFAKVASL